MANPMHSVPNESEIQEALNKAYLAEQQRPRSSHGDQPDDHPTDDHPTDDHPTDSPSSYQLQTDGELSSNAPLQEGRIIVRRRQRNWSWPLDPLQEKSLPIFKPLQAPSPRRPRRATQRRVWKHGLWWSALLWIAANTLLYIMTDDSHVLGGWSDECPATWLYGTSPDLTLLGYKRRFEDVNPPWRVVHEARARFRKCWHGGDRNTLHQNNRLNISFPPLGASSDVNLRIAERERRAFKWLTAPGFPAERAPREPSPEDGLPLVASSCRRCTFSDALLKYLSTMSSLGRNPDASQSAIDLPHHCPCSFALVWTDIRQTQAHLPRPRSVHPFYTDRNVSGLYRANDPYSWFVWLWGNDFFVPWRRTDIEQYSSAELLKLYAEGFWYNSMPGKRKFKGYEVRDARGVGVSREEREAFARMCDGAAPWCERSLVESWP